MIDNEPKVVGGNTHLKPREPYINSYTQFLNDLSPYGQLTAEEERKLITEFQTGLQVRDETYAKLGLILVCNFLGYETEKVEDFDERDLVMRTGKAAKELIILSNIPLIMSVVRENDNKGLEKLDVIQNGVIGLIYAVNNFDLSFNDRLSTYALDWIKQSIQRGFNYQGEVMGISAPDFAKAKRVNAIYARLYGENGRQPSMDEMIKETFLTEAEVNRYMSSRLFISLNEIVTKRGGNLSDIKIIVESTYDDVEETAINNVDSNTINKYLLYDLAGLTELQKEIVELRIIPDEDGNARTFKQIGEKYGISHQAACKNYNKALVKLRKACLERRLTINNISAMLT